MALEATRYKDMITGDPPAENPEPCSLALLAAACLGQFVVDRKKAAQLPRSQDAIDHSASTTKARTSRHA